MFIFFIQVWFVQEGTINDYADDAATTPPVTGAPGDNCPTATHTLVTAPGPGTLFRHRHRHRATLPLVTAPSNCP